MNSRARRARSLLAMAALFCGCGVSSPLFVADSDGDAGPERPVGPPMSDAGQRPRDSGVVQAPITVVKPPCGTGPGCDTTDLGGETCETLGLGDGTLLCEPTTCTLEVAFCTGLGRRPPCGTGPGCDPNDLGGSSCESLGMPAGVLACDPMTCTFDTALCLGGIPGGGGLIGGGLFGGGLFGGGADAGFFGGGFFGGGDDEDAGL